LTSEVPVKRLSRILVGRADVITIIAIMRISHRFNKFILSSLRGDLVKDTSTTAVQLSL
jgi:hypothetical protein